MQKIEWTEKFSVGVHKFDEQHEKLIGMFNQLVENYSGSFDKELADKILADMTVYAWTHFHEEEQLMEAYGYPDYEGHEEKHRAYKEKVESFCISNLHMEEDLPNQLISFLRDWWIHHILGEDMKYKNFFNEKGLYVAVTCGITKNISGIF